MVNSFNFKLSPSSETGGKTTPHPASYVFSNLSDIWLRESLGKYFIGGLGFFFVIPSLTEC